MSVKTIEQACALKEISDPFFEEVRTIDPVTHHTVIHRKPRPFVARGISGDEIFIFRDKDGRLMKVEYTEEGPVKTELFL